MDGASNYVPVPGSEPRPVDGMRIVGPVDPGRIFHITIYVRPRPCAPKPGAVQAETPEGIENLTHEQYERVFGADPKDLSLVEAFARGHGLNVNDVNSERRSISLSGSADAIRKAFAVDILQYEHQGTTFHRPSRAISVPVELAPIVTGVFGLDQVPIATPHS
jgi:kumamolisin